MRGRDAGSCAGSARAHRAARGSRCRELPIRTPRDRTKRTCGMRLDPDAPRQRSSPSVSSTMTTTTPDISLADRAPAPRRTHDRPHAEPREPARRLPPVRPRPHCATIACARHRTATQSLFSSRARGAGVAGFPHPPRVDYAPHHGSRTRWSGRLRRQVCASTSHTTRTIGGVMTNKSFKYGGIVASIVLIAFGAGSIYTGLDGRDRVQGDLAREQIVGTPDSRSPGSSSTPAVRRRRSPRPSASTPSRPPAARRTPRCRASSMRTARPPTTRRPPRRSQERRAGRQPGPQHLGHRDRAQRRCARPSSPKASPPSRSSWASPCCSRASAS